MPMAFIPSLKVELRLLHPYGTEDKTPRLMVKQFSTGKNTQRDSQSYTEKRRGRWEIEVARRRKVGAKMGESNLPVIKSLSAFSYCVLFFSSV